MEDSLVDRILNMYKSPETFSIVMTAPGCRRPRKEDRSTLDEELDSHDKCNIESETDYVKNYVQKDDEDYIKVIKH